MHAVALIVLHSLCSGCLDGVAEFVLVASTVVADVDLWLPGRYRGGCSGCPDGVADFAFGLAKRCRGVCASCCQHGVVDLALVV